MASQRSGCLNGCACAVFAVGFFVLGLMFIASGRYLAPQDNAALDAFRADPNCAVAALTAGAATRDGSTGACTVSRGTISYAVMRTRLVPGSRTYSHTPVVSVRLADGTSRDDELAGPDGRNFVDTVHGGAPARAQLFRGKLVRVAADGAVAETESAPDVDVRTDSQMPWVGFALIAVAVLIAYAGFRTARRSPTGTG